MIAARCWAQKHTRYIEHVCEEILSAATKRWEQFRLSTYTQQHITRVAPDCNSYVATHSESPRNMKPPVAIPKPPTPSDTAAAIERRRADTETEAAADPLMYYSVICSPMIRDVKLRALG